MTRNDMTNTELAECIEIHISMLRQCAFSLRKDDEKRYAEGFDAGYKAKEKENGIGEDKLKIHGVSRGKQDKKELFLYFNREPTNEEVYLIHDVLKNNVGTTV